MVNAKALATDARDKGCTQDAHLMVQRDRVSDKVEIAANKSLNKMLKHLNICFTLGERAKEIGRHR